MAEKNDLLVHGGVTADEILELAAQPVVYAWQDIAQAGNIVVIGGGPREGKSTLLFLLLAARLNRGTPVNVLGREVTSVPAGQFVVLIEGERGEASMARKLVTSLRRLGIDCSALERVIWIASRAVRIGSGGWDDLGRMVRAGLVTDIAIDPIERIAPRGVDDEKEEDAVFNAIIEMVDLAPTEDTRPVVWAVADVCEGTGHPLERVSGGGSADAVLLLDAKRKDGRVVSTKVTFAKLRDEPNDYPLPVEYVVSADGIATIGASEARGARGVADRDETP